MVKFWTNLQYASLALTIAGQVFIGGNYFVGQACYLAANTIAVARNVALDRPAADKVRDWALTALTASLMAYYAFVA